MRVFLSSTYIDLQKHRAAVVEALARMGQESSRMEVFGARAEEPATACFDEIDRCELFVGVYGHRYGFVPVGCEVSITESEYDRAAGMPRFCFLVDEEHPWSPKMVEREPGASKLATFRERLKREVVVERFTTPEDLAVKVVTSIGRHLSKAPAPRGDIDQVGAICYRRPGGALELLLVRTSGRRWIFPKGGVDEGEEEWRAAEREAFEEAGVLGRIGKERFTVFRHHKRDLKRRGVELRVGLYLLEVESTRSAGERYRDPTWFTLAEAAEALAEDREFEYADELRRVVREVIAALSPRGG